jgi:hypothetical protein
VEATAEKSKAQRVANRRNLQRIKTRTRDDEKTLSKYLPNDVNAFLPGTLMGPDDSFQAPNWLLAALAEVASTPAPTPSRPPAKFDTSPESLEHNSAMIASYDYDFERFLGAHQETTLGFGSEFRPLQQLERVLGPHANFPFFRRILEDGMGYSFKAEISKEQ